MIYLYGYKPVVSNRNCNKKHIKRHIFEWVVSSPDNTFVGKAIQCDDLSDNYKLFSNLVRKFHREYVLDTQRGMSDGCGERVGGKINVLIMLMREFCEVNVE